MTNKMTTPAITEYAIKRMESARVASMQSVCAVIAWGIHNPGEWIDTVSGKTPKGFKAFKAKIEAASNPDRVRQVVTVSKKAMALLAGVEGNEKALRDDKEMRKAFADHCNRLAQSLAGLTITQAIEGEKGLFETVTGASSDSMAGVKAAYAKATEAEAEAEAEAGVAITDADADADEAEAVLDLETKTGAALAIEQAIALLASVAAHGHAGQASAKAVKAMADFMVQTGKPTALVYAFDQLVADASDDIPRLEGMAHGVGETLAEAKIQTVGPIPAKVA